MQANLALISDLDAASGYQLGEGRGDAADSGVSLLRAGSGPLSRADSFASCASCSSEDWASFLGSSGAALDAVAAALAPQLVAFTINLLVPPKIAMVSVATMTDSPCTAAGHPQDAAPAPEQQPEAPATPEKAAPPAVTAASPPPPAAAALAPAASSGDWSLRMAACAPGDDTWLLSVDDFSTTSVPVPECNPPCSAAVPVLAGRRRRRQQLQPPGAQPQHGRAAAGQRSIQQRRQRRPLLVPLHLRPGHARGRGRHRPRAQWQRQRLRHVCRAELLPR